VCDTLRAYRRLVDFPLFLEIFWSERIGKMFGLFKKTKRPARLDENRIQQTSGYLIVMKPGPLIDWYEKWGQFIKYEKEHKTFRTAFSGFNVRSYRGLWRHCLIGPIPFKERDELEAFYLHERVENRAAITTWWELLINKVENEDINSDEDDDGDLLPSIELALEVYRLLDIPEQYEIIMVKRQDFETNPNTLGFDIGYWGGDHFSLIADTLVTPMFHPAPEEDYQELRQRLSALNPNILFDNPEDASEFRNWYKSKDWAETEDREDEFCIIQVDRTT
jgi:hypothetical protein